MNRLINLSRALPTPDPALTVAYTPIRLEMPGRQAAGHLIPDAGRSR
jgi:hypothetical protein